MATQSETVLMPDSGGRAVEAAWPDLFANLQDAYARVIDSQFELERRAAELETSRDLLGQVIASMSEALFLLDRTGRIVQVNPAALELIDSDESGCLGRLFTTICTAPDAPTSAWKILNSAPHGIVTGLETTLQTSSGVHVPITLSASVVRNRSGRIDGVLIVALDIRPLRQLQAQLVQNSKQAALRTLAAGVGRQLDEPLAIIRGYTQHLLQTTQPGSVIDSQTKEDLKRIERATIRMAEMTGYLQEIARPDYGTFKPLNINQLVEGALFLAGGHLAGGQGSLNVTREYQNPLPMVQGDWHELAQLILDVIEAIEQAAGQIDSLFVRTWVSSGAVHLQIGGRLASGQSSESIKPILSESITSTVTRHSGRVKRAEPTGEAITLTLSLPALTEEWAEVRTNIEERQ